MLLPNVLIIKSLDTCKTERIIRHRFRKCHNQVRSLGNLLSFPSLSHVDHMSLDLIRENLPQLSWDIYFRWSCSVYWTCSSISLEPGHLIAKGILNCGAGSSCSLFAEFIESNICVFKSLLSSFSFIKT